MISIQPDIKFEQLMIDLPNIYISRQFQLDREINIFQVCQRLLVAEKLGDMTKIIKLKVNMINVGFPKVNPTYIYIPNLLSMIR